MEAIPPIVCSCKIVNERLQFCALHENAQRLLAACEYVRKFLAAPAGGRQENTNLVQELILPYLDNVIAAARRSNPGS
jgi:hypothetical protein